MILFTTSKSKFGQLLITKTEVVCSILTVSKSDGKLLRWWKNRTVLWLGWRGEAELALEVAGHLHQGESRQGAAVWVIFLSNILMTLNHSETKHLCQGGRRQGGALQRRP